MTTPARNLLVEFVLEKSVEAPLGRRALLYRALAAELPGTAPQFKRLTRLADELEAIEERHEQLLLNFRERRATTRQRRVA